MSNDWFFEKFALIANAPGAVERMRNLVLQLAVTGRLVDQQPSDEPASELMKNAMSFVDGGVSSAQRNRDIGRWKAVVDSGLSELPLGWSWTCNALIGNTSPRVSVSDDSSVAFVPMSIIPKDYRESLNPEIRLWKEIKRGYTHFADGDIVVAKITPCFQNGKACVMTDLPGGVGAGTTELHVLRPIPNTVVPLYMLLIFKSPEFVNGGVTSFTGTAGQQRVSTDYFRYCPIPIPPLAEQKRIVAKVDELMGICDALEAQQRERESRKSVLVRASLSRFAEAPTPENLGYLFHKSYDIPPSELRKSILTLAVQGKLVPQDPNDEPAVDLTNINDPLSAESSFELPNGWIWVRLLNLADINGGFAFKSTDYLQNGIRVIRISDFDETGFKDHKIVRHPFTPDLQKFSLAQKNILMAMTGGTVGKSYFVKTLPEPMVVNQRVATIKISPSANPSYIDIVIRSEMTQSIIQRAKNSTNDNISMQDIKGFPIPLPPLAEQRRIVAKVDQLMALVDELERQQEASREKASKLLDAIVQEMTSGGRDIAATLES